MDTTVLFKVVGVGLTVAVACQILSRSGRDDQAMLVSLAGILIVLIMLVGQVSDLFSTLRSLFGL
jgi:stage III sporulation protein AC